MISPTSWGSPFGLRPWQDMSYFYSLMAIAPFASSSPSPSPASSIVEAKSSPATPARAMFASMVQLTHRNTRRYGGYIVHFGVVVVIIGSRRSRVQSGKRSRQRIGLRRQDDHRQPTPWSAARSPQDDNPNYAQRVGRCIDVYQGGKQIDTMTPVRRILQSQPARPRPSPTFAPAFKEDLYRRL